MSISFEKVSYKAKEVKDTIKAKAKLGAQKTLNWIKYNPQLTIAIVSVVGSVGGFVVKNATKEHHLKQEQKLKENYVYDRRLGHYWELNRKLSSAEWVEIDKRRSNGERMSDILVDLNVLK